MTTLRLRHFERELARALAPEVADLLVESGALEKTDRDQAITDFLNELDVDRDTLGLSGSPTSSKDHA